MNASERKVILDGQKEMGREILPCIKGNCTLYRGEWT